MIEHFLTYLESVKNYSKHTVVAYRNDLEEFKDFIVAHNITLSEARKMHVRSFIVDLKKSRLSNRTINRKVSSLKSFYKYARQKEYIQSNPTAGIQSLKTSKRLPAYVDEHKVDRLFHIIGEENFIEVRDRLILIILYMTGMRRSELIGLKEEDIDMQRGSIKVLGKGNKVRLLPMGQALKSYLQSYLEMKRQHFSELVHSTLFVTDKGNPIYPKMVYNIVNRFLKLNNLSDKQSPHVLRHTFATHLANNGADLMAIKDLLGHASLAATQVYTHNSIDALKKAYRQSHPKG